jgi:hypothetical protein
MRRLVGGVAWLGLWAGCADHAAALELGLWTLEVDSYSGFTGRLIRDWSVEGSGDVRLSFGDVNGEVTERCEGTLDAAAIAVLTETMNALDVLGRGDSVAGGADFDRTVYKIRATGGDAAGDENEFIDEIGAALELGTQIEALTRAQVDCAQVMSVAP